MEQRSFKVNDKVHWTRTKRSGRTATFTTMNATIIEDTTDKTDVVLCKYRNGQKVQVHTSRLRHDNERTELTDVVMAKAEKE